jgi:hypothetical protein
LTTSEFENALATLRPGSSIIYAVGFLSLAVGEARSKKENHGHLVTLQLAASRAEGDGFVHLTQRRLATSSFEYRASYREKGKDK